MQAEDLSQTEALPFRESNVRTEVSAARATLEFLVTLGTQVDEPIALALQPEGHPSDEGSPYQLTSEACQRRNRPLSTTWKWLGSRRLGPAYSERLI